MQVFPEQLIGIPVISLQTGMRIANTGALVIDPDRLVVVAFACLAGRTPYLILPQDIRQLAPQGILVDSDESLAEPNDIVRVAPLVQQGFDPIGLKVVTDLGRYVGKVENYTVAPEQFVVQKLHVRRPIWHSFAGASSIIDRTQVVDVTPSQIVVRDTELPASAVAQASPE